MEDVMTWVHVVGLVVLVAGTIGGAIYVEHYTKNQKRNP